MSGVLDLNQIVGHEMVRQVLQRAIAEGRVANAYLFHGPSGVGKTTTAFAFAKALHCVEGTGTDGCASCQRYDARVAHPDLIVLDGTEGALKIDQIRRMQEQLNYKAQSGGYKVCIMIGADQITVQAANSALKVLEEPPGQSVIILTGESPSQFLPTILSRCQVLAFQPVAVEVLARHLISLGSSESQAQILARLFEGRVGTAVNALSSDVLDMRNTMLGYLRDVQGHGWAGLYSDSTLWEKERVQGRLALKIMLSWYRDLLLIKTGTRENLVNFDWEGPLEEAAKRYELDDLLQITQAIEGALNYRQGTGYYRIYLDRILSLL